MNIVGDDGPHLQAAAEVGLDVEDAAAFLETDEQACGVGVVWRVTMHVLSASASDLLRLLLAFASASVANGCVLSAHAWAGM